MNPGYDHNMDRAPKKVFGPPMCSCCMKLGDDIKAIPFGPKGENVYWFIFDELNKPSIETAQSIDSILDFASEGFEPSEEAPDAGNYKDEKQGQNIQKIKFIVDLRQNFNYAYDKNLLCPECAQNFLEEKMGKNKQEDSENPGFDDGFNPDGQNGEEPRGW